MEDKIFSDEIIQKIRRYIKFTGKPVLFIQGLGIDDGVYIVYDSKIQSPSDNRHYNEFKVKRFTKALNINIVYDQDAFSSYIEPEKYITLKFPNQEGIKWFLMQ